MKFDLPTIEEIEAASDILNNQEDIDRMVSLAFIVKNKKLSNIPEVNMASGIIVGLQIARNRLEEGAKILALAAKEEKPGARGIYKVDGEDDDNTN